MILYSSFYKYAISLSQNMSRNDIDTEVDVNIFGCKGSATR